MGFMCRIGSLLGLVLNVLLSASHEGTLKCVMPINMYKVGLCTTECCVLVHSVVGGFGVAGWP